MGKKIRAATSRDIDDYLATVPEEARAALEKLRETIKSAAPEASEVISYRIPTFNYHGPLVGFAAFKDHSSFFVMSTKVMKKHKHDLKPYDTAKGTVRFSTGKPLPAALVKKLVRARIIENDERFGRRRAKT